MQGCMPAWVPACSSTACRCLRSGASSWMRCCSLRWTATLASGLRISEPRCCRVSWDACLAQCNAFVLEVEQTARMRHDVRNQAHAAMALAERGDYVRARDHISSFRSLIFAEVTEKPGRDKSFIVYNPRGARTLIPSMQTRDVSRCHVPGRNSRRRCRPSRDHPEHDRMLPAWRRARHRACCRTPNL